MVLTAATAAGLFVSSAGGTQTRGALVFALDHYECYLIKPNQAFKSRGVYLRDQFGRSKAVVVRPQSLCNPVSKNGGDVRRKDAHLVCYQLKPAGTLIRHRVSVVNQFHKGVLNTYQLTSLCLPSGKSEDLEQPAAIPPRFDHYACYLVKPVSRFPTRKASSLVDQFWAVKNVPVAVPRTVCNPVSKGLRPTGGTHLVNSRDHLLCYPIRPDAQFGPHKVLVSNQFEPKAIDVAYLPSTLCLPSQKRELKPDLTVQIARTHIPVSCPTGGGSCTTTVQFTITNLTPSVPVLNSFQVLVGADPSQTTTVPVSALGSTPSITLTATLGPDGNCYDPDCTVDVTVDSTNTVPESNETNNTDSWTVVG